MLLDIASVNLGRYWENAVAEMNAILPELSYKMTIMSVRFCSLLPRCTSRAILRCGVFIRSFTCLLTRFQARVIFPIRCLDYWILTVNRRSLFLRPLMPLALHFLARYPAMDQKSSCGSLCTLIHMSIKFITLILHTSLWMSLLVPWMYILCV